MSWWTKHGTCVVIGVVVGFFVVLIATYFMSPRGVCPGKCHGLGRRRHHVLVDSHRSEGFSPHMEDQGIAAVPVWVVNWSPPTSGTGTGYTVTYSGTVQDDTGKTVYSFKDIAQTSFSLPDTIPAGTYNVTVTATNEVGTGQPYSDKISFTSHFPTFVGAPQFNYEQPALGSPKLTVHQPGNFPDVIATGFTNKTPGNYSAKISLTDPSNGRPIPFPIMAWDLSSQALTFTLTLEDNMSPGQKVNVSYGTCNYDMCATQNIVYVQPGTVPGQISNLGAKFTA